MSEELPQSQADQEIIASRDRAGVARTPMITPRAIAIAIFLALIVNAWTKQAELVTLTSQISESTPPIASVLCLLGLMILAGLLRKGVAHFQHREGGEKAAALCRRLILHPGEILAIFVFLAITAAMPGVGLFRQVMPSLMVTQYFGTPADHLEKMATDIPPHWAPNDPEVARVFWEGGQGQLTLGLHGFPVIGPMLESIWRFVGGPTMIPWRYWLVPFIVWSGYLSAYFIAAFCLVSLFRRTWEEDERLSFPVSNLAVEMIRPEVSMWSKISFFRDPVVWIGLSLAVLYNAFNAAKVFNPAIPALGISYPLGSVFTESPWNTMRGLSIFWKPEILGIGYMVPSDVLLSIWVFTLLAWFVRPMAKMAGYEPPGFPYVTNQAMGAFIFLGIYFIYQGRKRLWQLIRTAFSPDPLPEDSNEPLSFRTMLLGAAGGMLVVFVWPMLFGVKWWVSLMYFGIMFLVLLVYCRNRAEMGFPIVWGYPLYMQRATMVSFLGSAPFVSQGHSRSFTLLTMFSWLQRSVNQATTSIGQEAYIAGEKLGEGRRRISRVVIAALVFGIMLAFLVNLSAYYEYGGLVLSSPGGVEGGQMTQEVLGQFRAISQWIDHPEAPDANKIGYTLLGSVMALLMVLSRYAWLRFPFHPGGYALAYCHQGSYMWFAALLLWGVKSLTLHIGGVSLYRRLARGFLALTLGHFFAIGVWSLVGLLAGEWVRRYIVWFL